MEKILVTLGKASEKTMQSTSGSVDNPSNPAAKQIEGYVVD